MQLFLLIRIYDSRQVLHRQYRFLRSHLPWFPSVCQRRSGLCVYFGHKLHWNFLPEPIGQLIGQVAIPSSFSISSRQIKRIICITVHLVDKSKDRNVSHDADLEQLSCLCLDTLGSRR